jgi:transglutaminase-like putative cysteine protease
MLTAPIPDSLRQGANVVRRLESTEIDIESPRKAKIHRHVVYTILNPGGDGYATLHTYYDRFHDLIDATGILYDANGKLLKKVRKGEMEDWSEAGSGILMTDSRVKVYHFSARSYPYSVSYEEDVMQTGLFVLPEWRPQPSPAMAVEDSKLVIRVPGNFPLRYKPYGYPMKTGIEKRGGERIYTWELKDRPAVREEPFAPAWSELDPRVLLASGEFEQGGYSGRLDSWTDLGRFVEELYRGKDQLPPEAERKVHALVDGLTDDRRKIDTLYAFLQQNTHYVGIELGIGGWQPFDANYVYSRKYGDCKALSNYMVALLKEAGIRACNVLIRSGQDAPAMDTGFVCSQFNHAIVVAFAGKDSVWLECTNPFLPAGYLSSFTADRDALLLDNGGGHVVHTPVYGVKENQVCRVVRGQIDSAGNLRAELSTRYSGLEQDVLEGQLDHLSKKEMLDQRQQALGLPNCTIAGLDYVTIRAAVPQIEEKIRVTSAQFATVSGSRLFISPGAFLRHAEVATERGVARNIEVALKESAQETDSVFLRVPRGYLPEGNLPAVNFSAVFGSYRVQGEMKGDELVLVCRFRQKKGIYPADTWPRLERFLDLVHREAGRQLVLIR